MVLPDPDITRLVRRWTAGEEGALDELVAAVYPDLKRIAHHYVQQSGTGGTINTTALVHEAYLRLASMDEVAWGGRAHFFAFCSTAMRRILIDFARRRKAAKRGGGGIHIPLREDIGAVDERVTEILALEQAMTKLERRDARMARIAECRFFGGLSVPETAEALDIPLRTTEREWAKARGFLHQALA